ncbi:MAG TPA: hypothetical protein PK179_06610 [Spirochaetales bacterium]|nr:hypothetical protein [Spirochaetales bacterium]HPM71959.1 hypothetical protein [Spirochaetales bacterium]
MSLDIAALALRFAVMAVATFLAIIVWSRVRDVSWMLIVVGIIAGYGDILYSLLVEFGLVPDIGEAMGGLSFLAFVAPNLPWVFFSIAFMTMLARRRSRP